MGNIPKVYQTCQKIRFRKSQTNDVTYVGICCLSKTNIWWLYIFWWLCQFWHFQMFLCLTILFTKSIYLKHYIFLRYVFEKVPSATYLQGNVSFCFIKIWTLHYILQSTPLFLSCNHFFIFSVELIHITRGIILVCTIYLI